MQWVIDNWIWILFGVGMIGMHMFGHGGHGGKDMQSNHAGLADGDSTGEGLDQQSVKTKQGCCGGHGGRHGGNDKHAGHGKCCGGSAQTQAGDGPDAQSSTNPMPIIGDGTRATTPAVVRRDR